jgi:hypothetical protein
MDAIEKAIETLNHYEEVCRTEKFYDFGLGAKEAIKSLREYQDSTVNQMGAELVNRAYELLDRIDIQTRATGHAINGVSEIKAIIASLTAPNPQPVSAALEALTFVCRTIGWLEVVPPYGDAVDRTKEADKAIECCTIIRQALAQSGDKPCRK